MEIINVTHLRSHILAIDFNDGHRSMVDFAPFLYGNAHPDCDRYKRIGDFLRFEVEDGNLNWDDYTMIFPIEDLYHNTLIKSPKQNFSEGFRAHRSF
ncbi:MAG: DUF2442 domain-containing protein [Gammaproteobacteria bacterium]|nr:DUF2442 domain-containing protein [Gammaproteobacteria bacterium]